MFMKCSSLLALLLLPALVQAQTVAKPADTVRAAFVKNTYTGTLGVGFMNSYRENYSVPAGFEKGPMTGFAPIYARAEYAVSNRVSIGFGMAFNTIYFNNARVDSGHTGIVRRTARNKWRFFSGGLMAMYHFGHIIKNNKVDLYAGAGLNLNNIAESAQPKGDSTVAVTMHSVTPAIRVGGRYFISNIFSLHADAGYDKLSIISVGASCRFNGRKHR